MNKAGIFLRSGFGNLGLGSGAVPVLIKSLDAHNIPITRIIGSSAGSFAVPLFSARAFSDVSESWMGLTPKNISKFHPIQTISHPFKRSSLLDSEPLKRYMTKYFNRNLDDIFSPSTIPFEIITTDLKTGETVFFQNSLDNKNRLLDICMASAAIVPFFEPKKIDGQVLVDGAFSNDMAIQRLVDSGCDLIFVIDAYRGYPPVFSENDPKESNWPGFLSRVTLINIYHHSRLRLESALEKRGNCKIVFIRPETDLPYILFLDFDEEIKKMLTQIGYWSAKKALHELGLDLNNI
ncbi:MAG TPA: patatin-like phospholipase family protein [Candidatus Paceibacterota bacterium]